MTDEKILDTLKRIDEDLCVLVRLQKANQISAWTIVQALWMYSITLIPVWVLYQIMFDKH